MTGEGPDLLSRFAANLPGAAFTYRLRVDGTDEIEFMNDGCKDIWGLSAADICNDPSALWDLVHPDDLEPMQKSVQISAESLLPWEHRFRITDAHGTKKHVLGRGTPERAADNSVTWLTFLFDVTRQEMTKAEVRRYSYQLSAVTEAIPDAFALFDPDETLVICNTQFVEWHGLPRQCELTNWTYSRILDNAARSGLYPDADGREKDWVQVNLAEFRQAVDVREIRYKEDCWLRVLDRPTRDGGRIAIRIEISNVKRRQNQLEHAAMTDTLTGLLNRRGLSLQLEQVARKLPAAQSLAVLHLDLDKFKTINDAVGHEAGDFVLNEVARRLRDVVAKEAVIARVGGDEFVVVLPTDETEHQIFEMAECLRAKISAPTAFEGRLCHVGASIGIAIWNANGSVSVEQSLLDADTALLNGKALGRNRAVRFHRDMREEALETAKIATRIKHGLDKGQFEAFFQPQLEIPGHRVRGFETLVRWRNDDGTFEPAGSFIGVAAETGLITQIDHVMLQAGLDAVKSLASSMRYAARMSLNLSSVQLRDPNFSEELLDVLFARGVSPHQIGLEILESTLLDERSEEIASNIHALAEAGFQIELDDFGTGHTALASLQRFPVHRIKIDQSLIRNIDTEPKKRAITEGIFQLCRKLDVSVIAEGVETEPELETVMQMGIELFQGFLLARPMEYSHLTEWLKDNGQMTDDPLALKSKIS